MIKLITQKTDRDIVTKDRDEMISAIGSIVCQCVRSFGKLACAGFVIDSDTVYMVIAHNEGEYSVMSREMTGMKVIESALEEMQFLSCVIAVNTDKGYHMVTEAELASR